METGGTLEAAAERLAALLTGRNTALQAPEGHSDLEFVGDLAVAPLVRSAAPADVWAVDGGQALVADARCVQLYVTRSARVRFRDGGCVLEEEGDLHATVLGKGDPSDVNLLRDRDEWAAVEQCVEDADPGALV